MGKENRPQVGGYGKEGRERNQVDLNTEGETKTKWDGEVLLVTGSGEQYGMLETWGRIKWEMRGVVQL